MNSQPSPCPAASPLGSQPCVPFSIWGSDGLMPLPGTDMALELGPMTGRPRLHWRYQEREALYLSSNLNLKDRSRTFHGVL